MKRIILFLSILALLSLACNALIHSEPGMEVHIPESTPVLVEPAINPPISVEAATPTPEVFIPLTQVVPGTAAVQPQPDTLTAVTFGRLGLAIPMGVADGASGTEVPRNDSEEAPTWGKTPGHLQVSLGDYYVLQGKLHQPQIYVYPALEYAELVPAAFESIHRLRNAMYSLDSTTAEQLPGVPFFNATQVFASNIQAIHFQNGSGVRFLSEYAQYPAPINNHELVYHFQGFSEDGETYIVAIFPITAPVLAESSEAEAALPQGGIVYPFFADPDLETLQEYYDQVAGLLNDLPADAFTPNLGLLDTLIQSMQVAP